MNRRLSKGARMNWKRIGYVGVCVAFLGLVVGYLFSPAPQRPVSANGDVGIPLDVIYQIITLIMGATGMTVFQPLLNLLKPWFTKTPATDKTDVVVPLPNANVKDDVFAFASSVVAFAKNMKDKTNIEHLAFALLAVLRDLLSLNYPTVAQKLSDLAVEVQQQFFKPASGDSK